MEAIRNQQGPRVRLGAPGFTLVELMVGVTGGLIIAIAVFGLASSTTTNMQREGRIGEATSAVIIGFQRLQADIARAGFLASPNIREDPRLCLPSGTADRPTYVANLPDPLRNLAPVRIETPSAGTLPAILGTNGITPDTLTLMGSYVADDAFPIWGADVVSNRQTITLQSRIGPLSRNGYLTAPDDIARQTILDGLFTPGRILRIIDRAGKHFYGIIQGAAVGGASVPTITLEDTPSLTIRSIAGGSTLCGLEGTDLGTASVINTIRYELQTAPNLLAANANLAPLYPDLSATNELNPWEAERTDLVRYEIAARAGGASVIAGSLEVVAEYAVDLAFGITAIVGNPTVGTNLGLVSLPAGSLDYLPPQHAEIAKYAAAPGPIARPDRLRSVRARLSVRSRIPDRGSDVVGAGGRFRFRVGTRTTVQGTTQEVWARMRTLQAEIAVRNLEGVVW
ncbi:MAG: hypothetical protein JW751_13940 [Polyangiaceae bacterium]|nr:hypothetical protein [Polyangiaceae bacterium]